MSDLTDISQIRTFVSVSIIELDNRMEGLSELIAEYPGDHEESVRQEIETLTKTKAHLDSAYELLRSL